MIRVGPLLYLDVAKTGSTFVRAALQALARPHVHVEVTTKHHGPSARSLVGVTDIAITVRHPKNYYSSLFRAGLEERGGMFSILADCGGSGLYRPDDDAFRRWAERLMERDVQQRLRAQLGLRSLRRPLPPLSLRIVAHLRKVLPGIVKLGTVRPLRPSTRWHGGFTVLHTERLLEDLVSLTVAHPGVFRPGDASHFAGVRRNATDRTLYSPSDTAVEAIAPLLEADRPALELWRM